MPALKLAFCLFAYRPYGGLQRDFYRIAQACAARGHHIDVFTKEWQGTRPDNFNVHVLPIRGLRNHTRNRRFIRLVTREIRNRGFDVVVGFNRMPGIDIYYAADPCYVARIRELYGPLYRLTARYRFSADMERAIFSPESDTRILLLSSREMEKFIHHYKTPGERFRLLPPGIARDRQAPVNAPRIRESFRKEFNLCEEDRLMLMVGSGFRTKGLDRAIRALASLPDELGNRTRLMVVGDDKEQAFRKLARKLGVEDRVLFMRGQPDVRRFMLGADLLIHPAYSELAGMVLLEAIIAGLPVLATDVCGYAFHIERAQAGRVLASPFDQGKLNRELGYMLDAPERVQWSRNGIRYGQTQHLYSMPEVVADYVEAFAERRGD